MVGRPVWRRLGLFFVYSVNFHGYEIREKLKRSDDAMSLTRKEIVQLKRIIDIAHALIESADKPARGGKSTVKAKASGNPVRKRRTGKELLAFRKILKAERKAGVPVAQIAKKHGVSLAYIYSLV